MNQKLKYTFHTILVAGSFILLVLFDGDIALILLFLALLLLLVTDGIFDILGYGGEGESVPIVKKVMGYVIGTMLFAFVLSVLLRILRYLLP